MTVPSFAAHTEPSERGASGADNYCCQLPLAGHFHYSQLLNRKILIIYIYCSFSKISAAFQAVHSDFQIEAGNEGSQEMLLVRSINGHYLCLNWIYYNISRHSLLVIWHFKSVYTGIISFRQFTFTISCLPEQAVNGKGK